MAASILVLEKNNILGEALRRWLESKFPGCVVSDAVTMEAVVCVVQTHPPEVILMGLGFQQNYKLEIMRQLKAYAPLSQIVILTTYDDDIGPTAAVAAGASACIPMSGLPPSNLQAVLSHLLSSPAKSAQIQEKVLVGSN
jgi:DNA-binding NarL/FixJ family response regulator